MKRYGAKEAKKAVYTTGIKNTFHTNTTLQEVSGGLLGGQVDTQSARSMNQVDTEIRGIKKKYNIKGFGY